MKTCENCRFWSDLIAHAYVGGIKALCLSDRSPYSEEFTVRGVICGAWAENTLGSIDEPELDPQRYDREVVQ